MDRNDDDRSLVASDFVSFTSRKNAERSGAPRGTVVSSAVSSASQFSQLHRISFAHRIKSIHQSIAICHVSSFREDCEDLYTD